MATSIPIYREQNDYGERESFYVPHFEVIIAGRGLPDDVVRDVMQVSYKDSIEEIDSFELTINNWDAQTGTFKYEPPSEPANEKMFDPGQKIELWMGYLNNMRLMLVGEITTLEPNFPEAGGSTLSVRGLNVLHSFRKKQHTWAWEMMTDSEIAQEIGKKPPSEDSPGLGVTVRVNEQAAAQEAIEDFVFMNNQFDILFLLERARRHGYSLYLALDGETGEQFLYFGPAYNLRDVAYLLEWGKTLSQFKPTLTTANQVEEVTVKGWDRKTKKPIEGKAKIGDPGIDINPDQAAVALAVKGRNEVITDVPVRDKQEADAKAKELLRKQREEMIKATGGTVGLPDLRSGRRVQIKNLGARFDGEYFITETTHAIGDSGYRTTFNARREKAL